MKNVNEIEKQGEWSEGKEGGKTEKITERKKEKRKKGQTKKGKK